MKETPFFFPWTENKRVHFVGIGGIGMSSLARWFKAKNWAVSGSDSAASDLLRELRNDCIEVKIGHKKANLRENTGLLVYNRAISLKNPEIAEARRRGIPALAYPEALEALTWYYMTVAVAGAHGKSTTTSLLSLMLILGRKDPTVIVGTKLKEFARHGGNASNFREGKSGMLVLEADEFHSSFLHYSPSAALITNIDREHLDWYGTFANVKKAFLEFVGNIRQGGVLVANRDDAPLRALRSAIERIAKEHDVRVVWYTVHAPVVRAIRPLLHIPGEHNLSNAVGAYTLARLLGVPERDALGAIARYRGAWRRFEHKGLLKIKNSGLKIDVYDDYAHHPTEIKATLEGAKAFFGDAKVICVFQPHQQRRLTALFNDFIKAFDAADSIVFLPTYTVAGRDTGDERHTAERLAALVAKRNPRRSVAYLVDPRKLRAVVRSLTAGDADAYRYIVIMMGAGTIAEYTKDLLHS